MEWTELQTVATRMISTADSNCDAASSLRDILDALVDANLDEHEEDGSDEEYERKKKAESILFTLAANWSARKKAS